MANTSMLNPSQVPAVTSEDLYNFHIRVFGSPAPRHLFNAEELPHSEARYGEGLQVEDDELGYYPDGVKRTLTDDQIAMFRHSEIYAILRERQVRQENLEAERGEESETIISQPEEAVEATALSDEEGEVRSDGEAKNVLATVPQSTVKQVKATHVGKKRKIEGTDTGYGHGRKCASRSARGLVRELDSATAEDQILDYDEEPSTAEGFKGAKVPAAQVAEHTRESQARPVGGKKIWWPTIEAT